MNAPLLVASIIDTVLGSGPAMCSQAETSGSPLLGFVIFAIGALGFFTVSFALLFTARTWENHPTSRIRSAAQGYVELEGIAVELEAGKLKTPFTRLPAVWFAYEVEQNQDAMRRRLAREAGLVRFVSGMIVRFFTRFLFGRRERDSGPSWVTIDSGATESPFWLDDGTGRCLLFPAEAQVLSPRRHVWYGDTPRPRKGPWQRSWWDKLRSHEYRYQESRLAVSEKLFATGEFHTARPEKANIAKAAQEILKTWVADGTLLSRFDVDGNGVVDPRERQQARVAAQVQAMADHLARKQESINSLRAPPADRPFVISAQSEQALVRRTKWIAFACLLAGMLFAVLTYINFDAL